MKEKDITNAEELEGITSELFGSFDPEDELWIVGGSGSITARATYTPSGVDAASDFDWVF